MDTPNRKPTTPPAATTVYPSKSHAFPAASFFTCWDAWDYVFEVAEDSDSGINVQPAYGARLRFEGILND